MHLPWQGRGGRSGSRKLFKTIVQDNYPHFVRILFDLHLQKKTCKHVDHDLLFWRIRSPLEKALGLGRKPLADILGHVFVTPRAVPAAVAAARAPLEVLVRED